MSEVCVSREHLRSHLFKSKCICVFSPVEREKEQEKDRDLTIVCVYSDRMRRKIDYWSRYVSFGIEVIQTRTHRARDEIAQNKPTFDWSVKDLVHKYDNTHKRIS